MEAIYACNQFQTELRFRRGTLEVAMQRSRWVVAVLSPLIVCLSGYAQIDKIVIAAGTPEDQALATISKEDDAQKKVAMYEDFLKQFAANPAAVAYGNWQLSQL
jgi:hypothetical protein